MADEVRAYCMKEKKEQVMKDVVITTTANGRRAAQGICSSCGTKMYKFLPKASAAAATSAAPAASAVPDSKPE